MDINFLKTKIKEIINSNKDKIYRNIALTAVITEALKDVNIRPIIVGGQAVEFYTAGGYSTMDIDLVTPASIEEIDSVIKKYEDIDWNYLYQKSEKEKTLTELQEFKKIVDQKLKK